MKCPGGEWRARRNAPCSNAGCFLLQKFIVNRIIKKQDGVVNKTFVQMLETLGYDIELTYVKKEG